METGTVALAKLNNNQLVIGKYDDEDGSLKQCFAVHVQQNGQGQVGVMIVPFFVPICEDKVNFAADKYLTITNAPEDMKNEYIKSTSGIMLANPGDLKNLENTRPILGAKS